MLLRLRKPLQKIIKNKQLKKSHGLVFDSFGQGHILPNLFFYKYFFTGIQVDIEKDKYLTLPKFT